MRRPLAADWCRSFTNPSRCVQTSPVRSLSVTTNEPASPTLRNLAPPLAQPVRRQHGGIARAQTIARRRVVAFERPRGQRQADAERCGFFEHGAPILADQVDVEGHRCRLLAL